MYGWKPAENPSSFKVADGELIADGKRGHLFYSGKKVLDYREAEDIDFEGWPGRHLSEGAFAIQVHDPDSEIHYRNIKVKPL